MILWKLDALLRARRIRGRDLAARLGVGENYLSRIRREPPERLSLSLLDALCRELDVGIEQLLVQVPEGGEGIGIAPPPPIEVRPRRKSSSKASAEPSLAPEAAPRPAGSSAPALRLALRPRRRPSTNG